MTLFETPTANTAEFSPDRVYRYALYRTWGRDKRRVLFVGLNPSTADESVDDPTIRRCKGFAADWGYGGLIMANLFALLWLAFNSGMNKLPNHSPPRLTPT